VPEINFGSMPNDGGNLILNNEEKLELLRVEQKAEKFIKPFISAKEFLNNEKRWCLWLKTISPNELKKLQETCKRVEATRKHRAKSNREATKKLADYPTLFGEDRQPETDYIVIPSVSSEKRKYIPLSFMSVNVITSNLCLLIPKAKIYHFGILTSIMHMAWVKYTCGRLKSDYRYSNKIVYNNFPWPKDLAKKNKTKVEKAAQKVLEVRAEFPDSSLADLYDPLTMPPKLVKAHQALDKAVDICYRSKPFPNEMARIEYLFELYNEYVQNQ
jgi:hypothetical protein